MQDTPQPDHSTSNELTPDLPEDIPPTDPEDDTPTTDPPQAEQRTAEQPPDGKPTEEQPLSLEEREERDRLIKAAHGADRSEFEAKVEIGRHLRDLQTKRLYRDAGTWVQFIKTEFGRSESWAYERIELADVQDALAAQGVEPLTTASHAKGLGALPSPELVAYAVTTARTEAAGRKQRLTAKHITAARNAILAAQVSGAPTPTTGSESRTALLDRPGLHVITSEATGQPDAMEYLGRHIVPWTDDAFNSTPGKGAPTLGRSDLDEVAEFAWSPLVVDPWRTAAEWAPTPSAFRATLFPERLGSPAATEPAEADGKTATVLVAPGVDLLHPDCPQAILDRVSSAIKEDRSRRYLLRTDYPERLASLELAPNAVVCVVARDAATAERLAAHAEATSVPVAIVFEDLAEAVSEESLRSFAWALVRGPRTTQEAFDSVADHLRPDQPLHVGRTVKVRPRRFPTIPGKPAPTPRPDRAPVRLQRGNDGTNGSRLPPTPTASN